MTTFDTTIQTTAGEFLLIVQDGSTMADLVVKGRADTVTVYCDHRALTELAAAAGAASLGQLRISASSIPVDIDTDGGVISVDQVPGLVAFLPRDGGADITVNDCAGHIVDGWLDSGDCERLSVALAAASYNL